MTLLMTSILLLSFCTMVSLIIYKYTSQNYFNYKLEYKNSDILQRRTMAAGILYSIIIPIPQSTAASQGDDSLKTLFPATYRRVKKFLKECLRAEIKAGHHSLVKAIKKDHGLEKTEQILNSELRMQLLNYSSSLWPFNWEMDARGPLQWWRSLEQHPDARALAVSMLILS